MKKIKLLRYFSKFFKSCTISTFNFCFLSQILDGFKFNVGVSINFMSPEIILSAVTKNNSMSRRRSM